MKNQILFTKLCSLKNSIAPFIYIFIQKFINAILIMKFYFLYDFSSSECISFWILLIIVYFFYFLTYFRDPGYIPLENCSKITGGSNQRQSPPKKMNLNCETNDIRTFSTNITEKNSAGLFKSHKISPISFYADFKEEPIQLINEKNILSDRESENLEEKIINVSTLKCEASFSNISAETRKPNFLDDLPSSSIDKKSPKAIKLEAAKNLEKEDLEMNIQKISNNIKKPETDLENKGKFFYLDDKLHTDDEKADNGTLYVEKRYCTVCNIEQILRSKHCKQCKRCVALYDHHCPWMEKNRGFFYLFLIFQLIQIIWALYYIIAWILSSQLTIEFQINFTLTLLVFICLLILIFFLIMVSMLLIYHTYLCLKNMTTWENVSWHKISYLKEWPQHYGSPFSMGFKKNILFLITLTLTNKIKIWTLPRFIK